MRYARGMRPLFLPSFATDTPHNLNELHSHNAAPVSQPCEPCRPYQGRGTCMRAPPLMREQSKNKVLMIASVVVLCVSAAALGLAIAYAVLGDFWRPRQRAAKQAGRAADATECADTSRRHGSVRRHFQPGCGIATKLDDLYEAEYLYPCRASTRFATPGSDGALTPYRQCDAPLYVHSLLSPADCTQIIETFESRLQQLLGASRQRPSDVGAWCAQEHGRKRTTAMLLCDTGVEAHASGGFEEVKHVVHKLQRMVRTGAHDKPPRLRMFVTRISHAQGRGDAGPPIMPAQASHIHRDAMLHELPTCEHNQHYVACFLNDLEPTEQGAQLFCTIPNEAALLVRSPAGFSTSVAVRPAAGDGIVWQCDGAKPSRSTVVDFDAPECKTSHVYVLVLAVPRQPRALA